MPSLSGLFGRKKKQTTTSSTVTSDFDSTQSSPTAEYIPFDRTLPSSPNGGATAVPQSQHSPAPSPNKLRLPFTRRKMSATPSSISVTSSDRGHAVAAPPSLHTEVSACSSTDTHDDPHRTRPPPSKSAIFATYGDPYAGLSTRSLPSNSLPRKDGAPIQPQHPKKSSLFNWSKPSPKPAPSALVPQPTDGNSFNLKSFRHISSASSPNTSTIVLPAPVPRPRGASVTSDNSQRISVAVFREAQARRSTAGSPAPSNRAPSPRPAGNSRTEPPMTLSPHQTRSELLNTSDTGGQSSEDDSDDISAIQHERGGAAIVRRQRTLTYRHPDDRLSTFRGRATQSELGHGSSATIERRFDNNASKRGPIMPLSPSGQAGSRKRASISTSAITPTAAARRASILAAANANSPNGQGHLRNSSTQSSPDAQPRPASSHRTQAIPTNDDSDESDNAPLANLLSPRRPGSVMSSTNGSTRSVNGLKPLIDINELTKSRPTPSNKLSNDGFTPGPTLLGSRGKAYTSTPSIHNSLVPTSVDPPTRFVSPPSSPAKEPKQLDNFTPDAETRATTVGKQKRDGVGERLNRVVQMTTGSRPSTVSTPASPTMTSTSSDQLSKSPPPSLPALSPSAPRIASPRPMRPLGLPNASSPPSPPDEELANMLGGGISLISRTGSEESSTSNDDDSSDDEYEDARSTPAPLPDSSGIAPIPIKQRAPAPSFAVVSRPPRKDSNVGNASSRSSVFSQGSASDIVPPSTIGRKQRSSTLFSSPSGLPPPVSFNQTGAGKKGGILRNGSSSPGGAGSSSNGSERGEAVPRTLPGVRQRCSTMLPGRVSSTAATSIPSMPPARPFAVGVGRRDLESPSSSTGDSSSGRAPFTPKDGSDIAVGVVRGVEDGKGRAGNKQLNRRSVCFDDDVQLLGGEDGRNGKIKITKGEEEKRRERRRNEAKAAIELGNVINGRGPILDDDEDDLPINQTLASGPRMSMLNPMMSLGGPMAMNMPMGMAYPSSLPNSFSNMAMAANMNMNMNMNAWPGQQALPNPQLLSPAQFMPPMPTDPSMLMAHQQAMMIAKQAYQMAVAQQAVMAAGDEWERGSSIGGYGGSGMSMYGGAGGGSSLGLGQAPFANMGMGNRWSSGSVVFPTSPRSAYGPISGASSDHGGTAGRGGGGHWSSSRNPHGEMYMRQNKLSKAGQQREDGYFPPVPPIPENRTGNSGVSSSRSRTTSQPAALSRGGVRPVPPSSWKSGGP